MKTQRKTTEMKLRKSPLVLVLGQVKFSENATLESVIPALQEEFRSLRYPIQHSLLRKKITVNPSGQVEKVDDIHQWMFRTKDQSGLVILDATQVVFQLSNYQTFEDFMKSFETILELVLRVTSIRKDCLVQRIGLRYVNAVAHKETDRGPEYYLRNEFLGVSDCVFKKNTKALGGATVGVTDLGNGGQGTLAVRVLTAHGQKVPPDLLEFAPAMGADSKNISYTLLDLDHSWSRSLDLEKSADELPGILESLHEKINEVFFEYLVTENAMREWR